MTKEERDSRWANGNNYNNYITAELNSFRKNAWKHQISKHLNNRKGLNVLDVGTGPGFFACILSEEGHKVTAIDSSNGMLEKARENAEKLGVSPKFLKMDINNIDLPEKSFQLIVVRNVIWTLENPEAVYRSLIKLLDKDGIILVYDANWHLHFYDEEKMKKVREREERYFKKYGRREVIAYDDLEYFKTAPLTYTVRPQWDIKVLANLGMKVETDESVGNFVYEEWEKDLYAESPLFEVCATF